MTDSALIIPAGIAANGHCCWELIDPTTGVAVDNHGDGIQHFDSLADAQSWAHDTEATGDPVEQPTPCWVVTAICGWQLDDDLPMVMHHATAVEALRTALDCDMRISPSGGLICDPSCDDCKAATGGGAR